MSAQPSTLDSQSSPAGLITGLPGEALVRQGLQEFESGQCTIPACLVGMARSRLRRAGLLPASLTRTLPDAELRLYRLLRPAGGDAYSRYNALVRELISFEQALDRRCQTRPGAVEHVKCSHPPPFQAPAFHFK